MKNKNGAGGIRLPAFRQYSKYHIKVVSYWYKNRNINQWNRIESSEINPCAYSRELRIGNGENAVYLVNGAGKQDSYMKE